MKNQITAAALLFLISFATSCEPGNSDEIMEEPLEEEIIFIPDEVFKNALVNTKSVDTNIDGVGDVDVDTNDDGEIQRNEAERITALILHFDYHAILRYVDLAGIENFKELQLLKMTGEPLYAWDVNSSPEPLKYDLTGLAKLEFLLLNQLGSIFIESIDLSGLNRLAEVDLSHNRPVDMSGDYRDPRNFIKVNLEGCSSLSKMTYLNGFLFVDFCQVPSLEMLDMRYLEGGEPELFDFRCLTKLKWLDISENSIDTLLIKNSSVLDSFFAQDIGSANNRNYPFLKYICMDDLPGELEQMATLMDENTVVNTNCEF